MRNPLNKDITIIEAVWHMAWPCGHFIGAKENTPYTVMKLKTTECPLCNGTIGEVLND